MCSLTLALAPGRDFTAVQFSCDTVEAPALVRQFKDLADYLSPLGDQFVSSVLIRPFDPARRLSCVSPSLQRAFGQCARLRSLASATR
jgi:hypothetical protein